MEWSYHIRASSSVTTLVKHGRVMNDVTRLSVGNGSEMVINNVKESDAGLYLCTEDDGFGAKHPVMLLVLNDGETSNGRIKLCNSIQ